MALFNMEHPLVGGYTPDKVALRRAIGLAYDMPKRDPARAQGAVDSIAVAGVALTYGYDPNFKSEMGEYNPAQAKALLDAFGYVDRDGDGWRELPDGTPMTLEMATEPDQLAGNVTRSGARACGRSISASYSSPPSGRRT